MGQSYSRCAICREFLRIMCCASTVGQAIFDAAMVNGDCWDAQWWAIEVERQWSNLWAFGCNYSLSFAATSHTQTCWYSKKAFRRSLHPEFSYGIHGYHKKVWLKPSFAVFLPPFNVVQWLGGGGKITRRVHLFSCVMMKTQSPYSLELFNSINKITMSLELPWREL